MVRRKISDIEWLGIVLAAVLVASLAWSLFQIYQRNHTDRSAEAAESQREARQEVFNLCKQKAGAISADCFAQAHQAYPEDKQGEYELQAQQETAEWALLAAITGVLSTIASFGALIGLFRTLREQREQFAAERRPWVYFQNVRIKGLVTAPEPLPHIPMPGDFHAVAIVEYEIVHQGETPALKFRNGHSAANQVITDDDFGIRFFREFRAMPAIGRPVVPGEPRPETARVEINYFAPKPGDDETIEFHFALVAEYRSAATQSVRCETIQSYRIDNFRGERRTSLSHRDLRGAASALALTATPWGLLTMI